MFLRVHEGTTVGAGLSEPVGERNERALRVVGLEQVRDEQEEVQEPSLGQREANRLPSLTFAELFLPDMRMGHVVPSGRRPRIEGDDAIGVRATAANPVPIKPDLERPQINACELDGRRGY